MGIDPRLDAASEGTGLGLALVKRIIEVHGGRIRMESEGTRAGCAFYFAPPAQNHASPAC